MGHDPAYSEAGAEVGRMLAERGMAVVYGGAKVGVMGTVADAALAAGGEVLGVLPAKLSAKEIAHDRLTELFVVESMHARKAMMAHLSDAFIVLPGGWGTLEETFEVLTWTQLRYHTKPLGLLNVKGYWDHIIAFAEHAVQEGLLKEPHRELMLYDRDPGRLLEALQAAEIPEGPRWIDKP